MVWHLELVRSEHGTRSERVFVCPFGNIGVRCWRGQNSTLRGLMPYCLGHRYSPVSKMWPQPKGEIWARRSGVVGNPALTLAVAPKPKCFVFQYMVIAASKFRPTILKC